MKRTKRAGTGRPWCSRFATVAVAWSSLWVGCADGFAAEPASGSAVHESGDPAASEDGGTMAGVAGDGALAGSGGVGAAGAAPAPSLATGGAGGAPVSPPVAGEEATSPTGPSADPCPSAAPNDGDSCSAKDACEFPSGRCTCLAGKWHCASDGAPDAGVGGATPDDAGTDAEVPEAACPAEMPPDDTACPKRGLHCDYDPGTCSCSLDETWHC